MCAQSVPVVESHRERSNVSGFSRTAAPPKSSRGLDVLPEHDPHAIDILHTELANAIRLVRRLRCYLGSSIDDFFVVGINILDPLAQVDPTWAVFVSYEVNRGVVAPHHGVGVVAEIPRKSQSVAVERCRGRDIRDMQHRGALNELFRIRRWQRGY